METSKSFIRKLSLIFALMFVIASCRDEHDTLYSPDDSGYAKDVTLLFNVSDAAMPGSRSESEYNFENNYLDDLWMIVFRKDTRAGAGNELRYYVSRKVEKVESKGDKEPFGNATVTLPSEIFRENFKMLFLANASDLWKKNGIQNPDDLFLETAGTKPYDIGKTLEECRKILTLSLDDNSMKQGKGMYHQYNAVKKSIPMYSEMDWKGNGSYPMTPLELGATKLLRSAARLDVGVNYGGQKISSKAGGLEHFKLTNVFVANTHDRFSVNPFTVKLDEKTIETVNDPHATYESSKGDTPWTVNKVSVPSGAPKIEEYIKAYVGNENISESKPVLYDKIEGRIFLPEEQVKKDDNAGAKAEPVEDVPFIIVEGYYGEDNIQRARTAPDKAVKSYYKLNFYNNDQMADYFDIKRGDLIRINISSVTGPGYPTPDDAASSMGKDMVIDISKYNIMNKNSAFDGQSYLAVERLDIEMPRNAGVFFKLLTDFGGDIKWDDIKLGYKDESGEHFPTEEEEGGITIGGLFKVKKETNAKSGDNHKDFNHWIRITNAKAWDNSAAPKTMLIRARNLTLQVSLEQKDISIYDWELGNEENLPLEGLPISSHVLYFEGAGNSQDLTVNTTGGIKPLSLKFYEKVYQPDDEENKEVDWLKVEKTTTGEGAAIINYRVTAQPNLSDKPKEAYGILEYTDANGKTAFENIKANQGQLVTADILSSNYGVKWLDRNSGATTNDMSTQGSTNKYKTLEEAKLSIPYGWLLPELSDFENIFTTKKTDEPTKFDGNIGFAIADAKDRKVLMMYTGYERAYIPLGKYWLNDGSLAEIKLKTGIEEGKIRLEPRDIEVAHISQEQAKQNDEGCFVRAIRKFRLEQNEVEMIMTGATVEVKFSTLNPVDNIKSIEIINGPDDKEAYNMEVDRDGSSNYLQVSAEYPNWTNQDKEFKFRITPNDGSEKNNQYLTVKFLRKLPASNSSQYVVLDGLMWDFKNLNSGQTESKPYTYLQKSWDYGGFAANSTQHGWPDLYLLDGKVTGLKGVGDKHNPNDIYDYWYYIGNISDQVNKCPQGWRLPTVGEWDNLIRKHLKVYNQPYNGEGLSVPKHNDKEYPVYYFTDGKSITYIQLGLSRSQFIGGRISYSHAFYKVPDSSGGTTTYCIGFNRFIYDPQEEEKTKFPYYDGQWKPAGQTIKYMVYWTSGSKDVFHNIRCVKSVEGKDN